MGVEIKYKYWSQTVTVFIRSFFLIPILNNTEDFVWEKILTQFAANQASLILNIVWSVMGAFVQNTWKSFIDIYYFCFHYIYST